MRIVLDADLSYTGEDVKKMTLSELLDLHEALDYREDAREHKRQKAKA